MFGKWIGLEGGLKARTQAMPLIRSAFPPS